MIHQMSSSPSLKTLNSIHVFTMKTPSPSSSQSSSSSSSLSSMKLKNILQTFIFSHVYRIARALTKAKSVLMQLLKDMHFINHLVGFPYLKKNKQKKLFFGSFRLHYNWCSSHAVPSVVLESSSSSHAYYDSSWDNIPMSSFRLYNEMRRECSSDNIELSRYLQWLEEKGDEDSSNEIDRLADLFIADCHEKFRLEKQESYRRFQEMMARSV